MNHLDLVSVKQEIFKGSKRLDDATKEIFRLAKTAAETERDYRVALAKEMMRLRDEKVPVTIINDVARGNLSELKFKRDLAKETYTAARDSLKGIQSQLSALQSILRSQEEI